LDKKNICNQLTSEALRLDAGKKSRLLVTGGFFVVLLAVFEFICGKNDSSAGIHRPAKRLIVDGLQSDWPVSSEKALNIGA
jgi:hypothetical protein